VNQRQQIFVVCHPPSFFARPSPTA
jgi:hypothetical protein